MLEVLAVGEEPPKTPANIKSHMPAEEAFVESRRSPTLQFSPQTDHVVRHAGFVAP